MKWMKKSSILLLSMALMLQVLAVSVAASEDVETGYTYEEVAQAIEQAASKVAAAESVSEWGAIGLYRAGKELPSNYLQELHTYIEQAQGKLSRITDYERVGLGVLAAGGSIEDVAGYNLAELIYNQENLARQGANGVIFALLLLNSSQIDLSAQAVWTETKLIDWIIDAQNDDGGWAIVSGQTSSIDITAMALTALAPYVDQENVTQAIEDAVLYLSQAQLADGSFPGASAESTAQVIVALTALGVDPANELFTKESGNPVSYLLSLQLADGSFAHLPEGAADAMATEQALLALVSLKLLNDGKPALYEGLASFDVEIYIEGPNAVIAAGEARGSNALEAVERMLVQQEIEYDKQVFSFGTLISSIAGIEQGLYGGYDGWQYAVKRAEEWIYPMVGIDSFILEASDQVFVYYGDYTLMLNRVVIEPIAPQSNQAVAITAYASTWDWVENEELIIPAAFVDVTINGITVTTDEDGVTVFEKLPAGTHEVEITGYDEEAAPMILRGTAELLVRPSSLAEFKDEGAVSGWAIAEVSEVIELGLMQGVSRQQPEFAPQRIMKRAEFAQLLANLLELDQSAAYEGSYVDVLADSWYSGAVAALSANGVLDNEAQFSPNAAITREQMALWVARALQLDSNAKASFNDIAQLDSEATSAIAALAEAEIMVGHNNKFRPMDSVTRETAAAVAVRVFHWMNSLVEQAS